MTTAELATEILVYAFIVNFVIAFIYAQKVKKRTGILWAIISSVTSIFFAVALPAFIGANSDRMFAVANLTGGLIGMVIILIIIATLPSKKSV